MENQQTLLPRQLEHGVFANEPVDMFQDAVVNYVNREEANRRCGGTFPIQLA